MTTPSFSKNGSLPLPAPDLAPFTFLFDLISKLGSPLHISRWNFLTEIKKRRSCNEKKKNNQKTSTFNFFSLLFFPEGCFNFSFFSFFQPLITGRQRAPRSALSGALESAGMPVRAGEPTDFISIIDFILFSRLQRKIHKIKSNNNKINNKKRNQKFRQYFG